MLNLRVFLCLVVALAFSIVPNLLPTLTSLAKNDPHPIYDSRDPQAPLYRRPCPDMEDPFCAHLQKQRFSISISPFGQKAKHGRNIHGKQYLPEVVCASTSTVDFPPCGSSLPVPITGNRIELGDLTGRINMIALLFGQRPENQSLPISLKNASRCLFHEEFFNDDVPLNTVPSCQPENPDTDTGGGAPPLNPPCVFLNDPSVIDPTERYASLTFPLTYHKYGVRLDASADITHGFGVSMQAGIAHIFQEVHKIRLKEKPEPESGNDTIENDLTCQARSLCSFRRPEEKEGVGIPSPECENFTPNVKKLLTGNFTQITDQLGINTHDFDETSVEEIRLNTYWRHAFPINRDRITGPKATCMPYVMFSGSMSPGKKKHPNKLFAIPFGNDGHNALGFSAGVNFDFIESIEISGEVGVTHFFARNIDRLRIPTSIYQKTLFPFTADARVKPGNNWHFSGKIATYHFLGNLSTYFQYTIINHSRDSICLRKPDPAFTPETLSRTTAWKTQVAQIGFTYDISPALALGFLWQAPLAQRNTYRSSTLLFTLNATF